MRPVVYLSYAAQDAGFAVRLRGDLGARDIHVLDAREQLSFGTEAWETTADAAIRAAQAVICVASPAALNSANVRAELAAAWKYTIPILLLWAAGDTWPLRDPAKGGGGIAFDVSEQHPAIDVRGSRYETGLKELVDAITDLTGALTGPGSPAPAAPDWREADEVAPRGDYAYEERVRGAGTALPDIPEVAPEAEPLPPPPPAPAPQPAPAPERPDWSGSAWPGPPAAPWAPPPPAPSPPPPVQEAEQAAPGAAAPRAGGGLPSQQQATFIAYCPKEVAPREWHPLLVYISADTPAAMAAVSADAAERLGGRKDQFRSSAPRGPVQLRRQTRLTIVPRLPGFAFNPPTLSVSWEEDVQRHDFRVSATSAVPGQASNGAITILEGPYLRAEIPISMFVLAGQARLDTPEGFTSALARVYRRIFPSYSRKDSPIVRLCEAAAKAMGDRYLMDLNILRAGERWDDRLLKAIAEADIFQLFWSEQSARSPQVEREWRYAVQLAPARPNFIRPVYWTTQPYAIPTELNAFHFDHLDPEQVGMKPHRFSLAALFGRV